MPSLSDLKVVISTSADTKGISETEHALGGLSAKSAAIMGAMAGVAQNLVFQGINLITSSVGDAAKRVDTLNNSNRTFENMGFSAQSTKNMMKELDLSIRGLPTTLNDAVTGVELLTGSTNDISQSRKVFDALNDGIIGFGGSAVQVNGAVIQLSQAFSNGKVDAQTWNSLIQNGMGPALDALARKMGMTVGQLKDGLSTGKVSVGDFQNALIDLDTKGGGGMKSLNKIAHDSTAGIGTGMENAKTAVSRGIADIITAIGSKNISNAITTLGKFFETLGKDIALVVSSSQFKTFMHDASEVIKALTKDMGPIIKTVEDLAIKVFNFLKPSFEALANRIETMMPQLKIFWNDILKPLAIVIGIVIVGALWVLINVLNVSMRIWQDEINWIQNVIHFFESLGRTIGNLWGSLKSGFDNAYNGMVNWARNVVNDIVSFFTGLPGRITKAVGNIAGSIAGDIKGAFHGLHIPGFATGVTNFGGGLAVVGEQGPELVSLPRGSSVYTNSQSQGMIGNTTHQTVHIGNIYLNTPQAADAFFRNLDQDTLLSGMGLTTNRGMN